MSVFLDSSILIAALVPSERKHAESLARLMDGTPLVYQHSFLETFSMLTGGRLGAKADADLVAKLIKQTLLPRVRVVHLDELEIVEALQAARQHGVRGGAVYDFMHLVAARKSGAAVLCTLNLDDFQQLSRVGDPLILQP
ncbi:PIN domain-containing protein [Prosthecobacter sp.]|uniref:PIN domain-containing protein n=1 Tax=Prosthecobacter sp. TaxID=1965333 RepID=UPI003784194C